MTIPLDRVYDAGTGFKIEIEGVPTNWVSPVVVCQ